MLKILMLRKKKELRASQLAELLLKQEDFSKREAELEESIKEANTEEEEKAVDEEIEKLQAEKTEYENQKKELEETIANIDQEIKELEEKQKAEPKEKVTEDNERKGNVLMNLRKTFKGLNYSERAAIFAQNDVKEFIGSIRSALTGETRSIKGGELTVPTTIIELIREDVATESKLIKYVNLKKTSGKGRQIILGAIPEAIWTEAVGKINELTFGIAQVEVDEYKVSGFIPVNNNTLEDSDVDLGTEIVNGLICAIAIALDKAILFGTGKKMPLGIATRLLQESKPSGYSDKAPKWVDLHTSNVIQMAAAKTDLDFFKDLTAKAGALKNGRGEMFWACNHKTKMAILAKSIGANASAAIVAGMNNQMPVIGGTIEELEFIPDNMIVFGFGASYLLNERKGMTVSKSEHYKFIDDQTLFKGVARYDGQPSFAESFMFIGIEGTKPAATAVTFATDAAN